MGGAGRLGTGGWGGDGLGGVEESDPSRGFLAGDSSLSSSLCLEVVGDCSRLQDCRWRFFSRLPAPVSRKPLAKGLLSIFSWVT